jgi:hypothetical protein
MILLKVFCTGDICDGVRSIEFGKDQMDRGRIADTRVGDADIYPGFIAVGYDNWGGIEGIIQIRLLRNIFYAAFGVSLLAVIFAAAPACINL